MKTTMIVAASAAVAFAQNASLPACGQTCVNSLIGIVQASPYNCGNNPTCFCCQPDFGFGIRDCSNQACGNAELANSAIAYAVSYCASALPAESSSVCTSYYTGSGAASATATASGSAAHATMTSGGAAAPSGAGIAALIRPVASGSSGYSIASTTLTAGGSDVTHSATDYTVASNGDVIATASGFTTTYASAQIELAAAAATGSSGSSGSVSMGSGSSESTASGVIVGSGASSSTGAIVVLTGGSSTAASTTAGGAAASSSSKSSSGFAPMITAAPAVVGAAALAILAL